MVSSIDISGITFVLVYLPLIACLLAVLSMLGDPYTRSCAYAPLRLLIGYLMTLALLWLVMKHGRHREAAFLLALLLYLVPWPLFFAIRGSWRAERKRLNEQIAKEAESEKWR